MEKGNSNFVDIDGEGGRRGVSKKPKVSGIIEEKREEGKIPTEEQTETETSSAS